MGNIYFAFDLEVRTMEALKETNDCADIINDLNRIRWAIPFGTDEQAQSDFFDLIPSTTFLTSVYRKSVKKTTYALLRKV